MSKAYELVVKAKLAQGIDSDNAFAVKNGFQRAHINNWKAGLANPSALNYLKLAKAAGMSLDEALNYLETPEYNQKQAGFTTLEFMLTTVGMGIAGVSLISVTSTHGALLSAALGGAITAGYTLCEVLDNYVELFIQEKIMKLHMIQLLLFIFIALMLYSSHAL